MLFYIRKDLVLYIKIVIKLWTLDGDCGTILNREWAYYYSMPEKSFLGKSRGQAVDREERTP